MSSFSANTASQSAHWIFPVAAPPQQAACIRWREGKIVSIDPAEPDGLMGSDLPEGTLYILTPGFVNTHAHLEFSGYPVVLPTPGETMADWLAQVVALTRSPSTLTPLQRAGLGAEEALRYGTTCLADISATGASLQAMQALGLRGHVLLEWFHPSHTESIERLEAIAQQVADRVEQASGSVKKRLTIGVSPHSPFNVSPFAWRWLDQRLAERLQGLPIPWQVHLAESADEVRWLAGDSNGAGIDQLHQALLNTTVSPHPVGLSPVGYLLHHGLLRRGLSVAHGIELTLDEQAVLAQHGVGLAHCPRSNVLLHGKTAPLATSPPHWAVGLGTDSHLSTPDLDLRQEALLACRIHGWSVWQALEALTMGGAAVMGLAGDIGQLTSAYRADMVLWRVPTHAPNDPVKVCQDLLNYGVVETVWVDGEPIYSYNFGLKAL